MSQKERILHVALRTDFEKQPGLERALIEASEAYRDVDWMKSPNVRDAVLAAAREINPTLVFMQLQCGGVLWPDDIKMLRRVCDSQVVIVNWDGDQHHEPESEARRWFVELGQVCDASYVVNTIHPKIYTNMGVKHAGYLQIGYDDQIYRPVDATPGVPPVVFLGSRYASHQRRNEIIDHIAKELGPAFAAYGHGWPSSWGRPMLKQDEEAGVYAAAKASICMSIRNDLHSYTSDRLFRAMGSGAVALVERFPEMSLLDVGDDNAILWKGVDGLLAAIRKALNEDQSHLRSAAAETARGAHSWTTRIDQLLNRVAFLRLYQ